MLSLALCAGLCLTAVPTSDWAADATADRIRAGSDVEATEVYDFAPEYTVTIPESVPLGQTGTITLSDGKVPCGHQIQVFLSGASEEENPFTLKTAEGAAITYKVQYDTANGKDIEINEILLSAVPGTTESKSTTLYFHGPLNEVRYAGTYTGSIFFTVSVVDHDSSHSFENGKCTVCGYALTPVEVTSVSVTPWSNGASGSGSVVMPEEIDLSTLTETYTISDSKSYYFYGSGSYGIQVTSGNPDIYLSNAGISVASGNGINITGGNAAIHVQGNSTVTSDDGAGIYVAEGKTVTITGDNRSDVLTVSGANGNSGIGGYVISDLEAQSANSGSINIKNVTVYAYSSSQSLMGTVSPGIGSTGDATCQSISIDNATVHAYGCGETALSAPAIGNSMNYLGRTASTIPTVTISNHSEVHAHRGERNGWSFADYIGRAGSRSYSYNDVMATVDATSVVYKYTGTGNVTDKASAQLSNAQTRAAENNTGSASALTAGDEFSVKFADDSDVGTYRMKDDGTAEAVTPLYWKTAIDTKTVKAWYPATDGTVSLADQSNGLAYVLQANTTANFNQSVNLTFNHQLAKVRVQLGGATENVESVQVYGYTTCTHTQGTVSTEGATQSWITMRNVGDYWEANLAPGAIDPSGFVRLNGSITVNISGIDKLEAGQLHTVGITAIPSDAKEITGDISDSGNYIVRGTRNTAINITDGSPTIYLDNANISASSGNAINITGGNPTIHVAGDNNTVTSGNGAGIFVAEGKIVTITGSSREDKLTVTGAQSGNGIGGYSTGDGSVNSGNISVSNITLYAYGSDYNDGIYAPGIGGSATANCETITIDNATVYAYGTGESHYNITSAAIGGGIDGNTKGSYSTITIKNNSEVYVERGNHLSDYIGHSGSRDCPATATNGIDATVDASSTITKLN